MADDLQDEPVSPASPAVPQDGQIDPALQKAAGTFNSQVGQDWSQQILGGIQQHLNEANVVNANTQAGDQFVNAVKSVKDNLIEGARGDPTAARNLIDLAPQFIGPLLETTGMPYDKMVDTHNAVTSEVQEGIAHAAVTKMADFHAPQAYALMDSLKGYISDDGQQALGAYINTMHAARVADNDASFDQAQQNQSRASAVAAFKFGSTLLDPRTEQVQYPQGYLQSLVRNQTISPEDKQGLFSAFSQLRANGDVHASDPYAVAQVLNDIIDPRTNVAHNDIMDHVGNDLKYVDAVMLHGMNLQQTPEGKMGVRDLQNALSSAQENLASTGDRAGNAAYSRFVNWLLPAYRRAGMSGLNPDSDNYLFKSTGLANFQPSHNDAVAPMNVNRKSLSDIFSG